jgi:hypothetical protein
MAFLVLVPFLMQPARLSPADQAARATLRRAVDRLENGTISRQQFERLAPRRNVPNWQRLQRRIHYPQSGALDLAFVLAYYGVDYRRNLQRLLLPDQLWQRGKALMPESLTGDLVILHDKHHDTASLGALLDLSLDGDPAEEQEAAIYELWQRQPVTLLRVAARSRARLGSLEVMVQMEGDDAKARKQLFAELRQFGHHPDRRVAGAAQRLLSMARRDFAQERG